MLIFLYPALCSSLSIRHVTSLYVGFDDGVYMTTNLLHWHSDPPFGVSDIEPDAAGRYKPNAHNAMIREQAIRCCVRGCNNWLSRVHRGKTDPNVFCPAHGIRMSTRPTYVYRSNCKNKNLILGRDFFRSIEKVESWRMGNENSEDALSWNVCASFLKVGALGELFKHLTGFPPAAYPTLYLWGNEVSPDRVVRCWPNLMAVRGELENDLPLPTEPDIALAVPGHAVVLVEAKFGSSNSTFKGKEDRFGGVQGYLKRYCVEPGLPDPLQREEIARLEPQEILQQLCRNAVFAARLTHRTKSSEAVVINLVRATDEPHVEEQMRRHVSEEVITFRRRTWESVLDLAKSIGSTLEPLRCYMENKTYCLQRAFSL